MSLMEPMDEVRTRNWGASLSSRSGKKAWIRLSGPMVLTSRCSRTFWAGVCRVGAINPIRPALEIRMSTLVMECFVSSSLTAEAGSESTVESTLTTMSLLFLPTVSEDKSWFDLATSRTAAMTVLLARARYVERRALPIPLFAPVMTIVWPDIVADLSGVSGATVEYTVVCMGS